MITFPSTEIQLQSNSCIEFSASGATTSSIDGVGPEHEAYWAKDQAISKRAFILVAVRICRLASTDRRWRHRRHGSIDRHPAQQRARTHATSADGCLKTLITHISAMRSRSSLFTTCTSNFDWASSRDLSPMSVISEGALRKRHMASANCLALRGSTR